jgi:hypothetical protein
VTNDVSQRFRQKAPQPTAIATHKYPINAYVLHKIGMPSHSVSFRVTRQLPDGGAGLQYRIKAERDGHERVVIEAALDTVTCADIELDATTLGGERWMQLTTGWKPGSITPRV